MRLSADASLLLQTVWDLFALDAAWPPFAHVDRLLHHEHSLDVPALLEDVPTQLLVGGRGQGGAPAGADEQLRLTAAGAAACSRSGTVLALVVAAAAEAVRLERDAMSGTDDPHLTADLIIDGASDGQGRARDDATAHLARQVGLLLIREPWASGGSLYEGGWSVGVSRRIRVYAGAGDIDSYLGRSAAVLGTSRPAKQPQQAVVGPLASRAVDPQRAADELRLLAEQATDPAVRADGPAHDAWKARTETVMLAALDAGSPALRAFKDIRYNIGFYSGAPGEAEQDARYFAQQVDRAKAQIETAGYELQLRSASTPGTGQAPSLPADGPIFVVHGHDVALKYELVRLLDRTTDRDAQILHEQPNKGTTVLEKLERHGTSAAFAVVLLTGDDEGRPAGRAADLRPRGRQNVIFELGLFIGLLGRARVAVLVDPAVERPSDLDGLVYIKLDPAGAWRHTLLTELEVSGIAVDRKRVP